MKPRNFLSVLVLVLSSLLILSGCSKKPEAQKLEDKVVAEVNGEKIYNSEVEVQLNSIIGAHAGQLQGEEGKKMIEQFRKQILEQLIDFRLIIHQAKQENLKATDEEVNKRIEEIKKQFPNQEEFKNALSQAGLTEAELPEKVREQILAEKMLEKIFSKIKVEEKEMKDYYEKNKKTFYTSETAEFAHIMVADENTAKKVLEEIKGGLKFEEAVQKYSMDRMTKNSGGSFGPLTRQIIEQMFGPDFARAVFSMKQGEVYEKPLATASGFHIVKLLKITPAHQKTYEESKNELKNILMQEKQRQAFDEWIKEARKKANIKRYI